MGVTEGYVIGPHFFIWGIRDTHVSGLTEGYVIGPHFFNCVIISGVSEGNVIGPLFFNFGIMESQVSIFIKYIIWMVLMKCNGSINDQRTALLLIHFLISSNQRIIITINSTKSDPPPVFVSYDVLHIKYATQPQACYCSFL